MYLDRKVELWFQGFLYRKKIVSWKKFVEAICYRFREFWFEDVVEEFNKLSQWGLVIKYQERFKELQSLILAKNPYLNDTYFLLSFISRLQMEIKSMVIWNLAICWLLKSQIVWIDYGYYDKEEYDRIDIANLFHF